MEYRCDFVGHFRNASKIPFVIDIVRILLTSTGDPHLGATVLNDLALKRVPSFKTLVNISQGLGFQLANCCEAWIPLANARLTPAGASE